MRPAPLLLLVLASATAATGAQSASGALAPGVVKLAAIRRHLAPELKRSSALLCLETIERTQWDRQGKLKQTDRLQVEVAFTDRREWFAWPGDEAFTRETPADLSGGGLGSSGELAGHLNAVFLAPGAGIQPLTGAEARPGLLAYRYSVPIFGSAYRVAGFAGEATVASAGRFWVNEATLDMARLETRAVDIPVETGMREVITVIDYARTGGGRLAPQRAVLTAIDVTGAVNRNQIEFSHCREFGAWSAVSFDSAPGHAPAPAPIAVPASVRVRWPERLALRTRLEWSGRALAEAHAGEDVEAVLVAAVRHKGKELAPAGAKVRGRLRWLEKRSDRWVIGVELQSVETGAGGGEARFLAALAGVHDPGGSGAAGMPLPRQRERRWQLPSRLGDGTVVTSYEEEEVVELLRLPGVGLFTLPLSATAFPRGLELSWVTE